MENIRVKDIMSTPPHTIVEDATLAEAAACMLEQRVGAMIIVDGEGLYRGLISERMLMPKAGHLPFLRDTIFMMLTRHMGSPAQLIDTINDMRDTKISDNTSLFKDVPTVEPDDVIHDVAEVMMSHNIYDLPVLDAKRPVGMISHHDFLKFYAKAS